MSEQELNRKLAVWAGWHDFNQRGCGYPPDNIKDQPRLQPIFTQSLDACFKYLEPLTDGFIMFTGIGGIHTIISKNLLNYEAMDKEASVSFCLAIEKLIDRGE